MLTFGKAMKLLRKVASTENIENTKYTVNTVSLLRGLGKEKLLDLSANEFMAVIKRLSRLKIDRNRVRTSNFYPYMMSGFVKNFTLLSIENFKRMIPLLNDLVTLGLNWRDIQQKAFATEFLHILETLLPRFNAVGCSRLLQLLEEMGVWIYPNHLDDRVASVILYGVEHIAKNFNDYDRGGVNNVFFVLYRLLNTNGSAFADIQMRLQTLLRDDQKYKIDALVSTFSLFPPQPCYEANIFIKNWLTEKGFQVKTACKRSDAGISSIFGFDYFILLENEKLLVDCLLHNKPFMNFEKSKRYQFKRETILGTLGYRFITLDVKDLGELKNTFSEKWAAAYDKMRMCARPTMFHQFTPQDDIPWEPLKESAKISEIWNVKYPLLFP